MATSSKVEEKRIVAVVGSGLIGRSFAMLFAASDYRVRLIDQDPNQVTNAIKDITQQLHHLKSIGLLRGKLSVSEQLDRIEGFSDLEKCVKDAFFVMECVPERLHLKKDVHGSIDKFISSETIVASSASALVPSLISADLEHKEKFIVVHPTNPPFYAPLVELVPAPWTQPDVVTRTKDLVTEIGQSPVILKKEIEGFVLNRLQYALIGECFSLVQNGVMSVEDIDKVMSEGLGRRYAFMGPLETAYLNADGFHSYADRYRDMIFDVQSSFEAPIKMEGKILETIHDDIATRIPLDKLTERRKWRDTRLSALDKLKRDMNN